MNRIETTRCSGGDCVQVVDIGNDWYRLRSTINPNFQVAVTGDELRAFLRQVKVGQFDDIAELEPDTTVTELADELALLRAKLDVVALVAPVVA